MANFLVFPFNLDISKTYNHSWENTCRILTKNRNLNFLKECYLGRREWLATSSTESKLISLAEQFANSIYSNINNQEYITKIIKNYFENKLKITLSSFRANLALLFEFERVTNTDGINYALGQLKENNEAQAAFIHYERKPCSIYWVVLKLGTNSVYLKNENIFKSLASVYDSSYSKHDDSFNLELSFNLINLSFNHSGTYSISSFKFEKENFDQSESRIYPLQKRIGEDIFNKVKAKIDQQEQKFDNFKMVLLIPPRISLKNQTNTRLTDTLTEEDLFYINPKPINQDFVYMASKENLAEYNKFLEEASNEKTTFYLIIQDECHWGMAKNTTPYNIQVIKDMNWRNENLIIWDEIALSNHEIMPLEKSNYSGLKQMIQAAKIRHQSEGSKKCAYLTENFNEIAHLLVNKKILEDLNKKLQISKPELSIMLEYFVTLRSILSGEEKTSLRNFITFETKLILQSLTEEGSNGKGVLVLLRMNNSVVAKYFKKGMIGLLKHFKKEHLFDVVLDTEENDLWDSLSLASQKKYWDWRGQEKISKPEKITYKHLADLPILLIVIEKARMGDTLPENFKFFDLRCRYTEENGNQTIYSSLLQDVGRAFGYGERPTVFLTDFIYKKLNSDDEFLLKPHQTLVKNEIDYDIEDPLDLWKMAKNHQYNAKHLGDALNRRFLLSANPQNGKTGAFLMTIKMFIEYYRTNARISLLEKSNPKETTEDKIIRNQLLYELMSIKASILNNHLKDGASNTRKKWHEYHRMLSNWKKQLKTTGIELGHEKCIKQIESICNKSREKRLKILDLGCGSAEIAQYFYDSRFQKKYFFKSEKKIIELEIISVDHNKNVQVPHFIEIMECDMGVISDCFPDNSFDIIVFCCSMWGEKEDICNYIKQAKVLLKKTSKNSLIILENQKNIVPQSGSKSVKEFIQERTDGEFSFIVREADDVTGFFLMTGTPNYDD